VLKLVKLEMRERFTAPYVGLNFGWVGTVDYEITIHMMNMTPRMEQQSEDTIQADSPNN
jgi:hypothetical protein